MRGKFNMMKKAILYFLLVFTSVMVNAQFYYSDIIVTKAANQRHQLNRQNKVKSIKFASFDAENQPIEGFVSTQNFSRDFLEVNTATTTTLTGPTLSTSWFNNKDQLIKTLDTSDGSKTQTTYQYNSSDQLSTVNSVTTSAGDFVIKEEEGGACEFI
jgi:hypothetical protein